MLVSVLCGLCGLVAGWLGRFAIVRTADMPEWLLRWRLPELSTAVLFGLAGWRLGLSVELLLACFVIAVGVALSIVDLAVRRLPNMLTLPAYAVVGLGLVVAEIFRQDWGSLARAFVGAGIFLAVYGLLWLVGGMGLGDVKLSGVLGLALGWLGWPPVLAGLVLGFVYGGLISGILLVAGRAGRKTRIPFGPFMIAGTVTAFLVS
ncbi:prepilin peptidase [Fodinicola feengrottensis]|uniref:Prepilin type IV endopeptidase peptidase domain-containing protein n=1 Tax=Fodinicola feengrottensis TaxID=435914 RepID=A0ABN2G3P1_9ACTN|nr:A24 family peptidase [Fodinicola feengrottensis]